MDYSKRQFILDEYGFLPKNEIEARYDYLTLKYTINLEKIEYFIKEQFESQGLEDVEFKYQNQKQGDKYLKLLNETSVKDLKEKKK